MHTVPIVLFPMVQSQFILIINRFDVLILKKNVNEPSKKFCVCIVMVISTKIEGSGTESGCIRQRYGSGPKCHGSGTLDDTVEEFSEKNSPVECNSEHIE
jgi:hypothetical protein